MPLSHYFFCSISSVSSVQRCWTVWKKRDTNKLFTGFFLTFPFLLHFSFFNWVDLDSFLLCVVFCFFKTVFTYIIDEWYPKAWLVAVVNFKDTVSLQWLTCYHLCSPRQGDRLTFFRCFFLMSIRVLTVH